MSNKQWVAFLHMQKKSADHLCIHRETDKALKQWQLALSIDNSFSNFEFSNFLCWTPIGLLSYKSLLYSWNKILNFKNCVDQHVRTHLISAFLFSHFKMQVFWWCGSYMNLHTYVCFVYDGVHHFKQHYSKDRTKMGIKEGRKTKERVF